LKKYENKYKVLKNNYRLFLEKLWIWDLYYYFIIYFKINYKIQK
jgi:hypothetical protein